MKWINTDQKMNKIFDKKDQIPFLMYTSLDIQALTDAGMDMTTPLGWGHFSPERIPIRPYRAKIPMRQTIIDNDYHIFNYYFDPLIHYIHIGQTYLENENSDGIGV